MPKTNKTAKSAHASAETAKWTRARAERQTETAKSATSDRFDQKLG